MVPSSEMPMKTLPTCLLLDLRRKGIRVPPELQIRIMYFKEMTETREAKEQVMLEIKELTMCHRLQMPQYCGEKAWKSSYQRVLNWRTTETVQICHWCSKFYQELLSIGARAQMSRPVPHLGRLFDECSWLVMELYHQRCNDEPIGMQLRNGNRMEPQLTSVESVMKWTSVTASVVDILCNLNRIERL